MGELLVKIMELGIRLIKFQPPLNKFIAALGIVLLPHLLVIKIAPIPRKNIVLIRLNFARHLLAYIRSVMSSIIKPILVFWYPF